MSRIVGIATAESGDGKRTTTLHLVSAFDDYFDNPEAGRSCIGQKTESVYLGTYDCSKLKIGQEIEILYGKAVTTARGTFQPVKRVDIIDAK